MQWHNCHAQHKGFRWSRTFRHICADTGGVFEDSERRAMNISVSVPEQLYKKAVEIAETQHVSVDEVFASAFTAQLSAWERIQRRAVQGNREKFLAMLDKVPDVVPDENDRFQ